MSAVLEGVAKITRRLPMSRTKVRAGRALTMAACAFGVEPVRATTLRDGTRLVLDPRSRTEAGPYWDGRFEPVTSALLMRLLDAYGPSLYDVGANVGLIAVPMARHVQHRPGASVVAFEPVEVNCRRLRQSVKLNGLDEIVRVLPLALGDSTGTVIICREARFGATSGNAVLLAGAPDGRSEASEVPMARLDDVVAAEHLPPPDVMKLDIEGTEALFLAGARETMTAHRPVILGEFHNVLMPRFGHTFMDAWALVPPGYHAFAWDDEGVLTEAEPAPRLGDVVLVPDEKLGQLPTSPRRAGQQ